MNLRFEDLGVVPDQGRSIWVAIDNDTDAIAGAFAFDVRDPDRPVWVSTYVVPEARGQGVYHAMTDAYIAAYGSLPEHCNIVVEGWHEQVNSLTSAVPGMFPIRMKAANGEAIGRLLIEDAERLRASTRHPE